MPDRTFEDGQHELVEAPLFTDVEQHLGQLPAESAPVKLWGNVELVTVRELGLICFANTGMNGGDHLPTNTPLRTLLLLRI